MSEQPNEAQIRASLAQYNLKRVREHAEAIANVASAIQEIDALYEDGCRSPEDTAYALGGVSGQLGIALGRFAIAHARMLAELVEDDEDDEEDGE